MKRFLVIFALLGSSSLSITTTANAKASLPPSIDFWSRRSAHNIINNDFMSNEVVYYAKRDLDYITDEAATNPIQAAKDVQAIPYLANNVSWYCFERKKQIRKESSFMLIPPLLLLRSCQASGVTDTNDQLEDNDSDESQLSWNMGVPFIATANTNISAAGGWEALPVVEGFNLNRSWEVKPGAIMPFYSTSGLDPSQIKRAVITWPGKWVSSSVLLWVSSWWLRPPPLSVRPRDAWKYANLFRNALEVVYSNQTYGVANDTVLIISPVWLNELDQQGGSVMPKELYFHGSEWEAGGNSVGPTLTKSFPGYAVMDNFTDMLFDKAQYPNLNQVVWVNADLLFQELGVMVTC
jgi:hypothetical protein